MKFLIAGLGNIGKEYKNTRHNIGFQVLDHFAKEEKLIFEISRYGYISEFSIKGRKLILLKPSTYMNRSGVAIRYWLEKENVNPENLFVIIDDIALPFGKIRIRAKGSEGGHNGLLSITESLGHNNYPRLRFGIGNNFAQGHMVEYVLSEWDDKEKQQLPEKLTICTQAIRYFVLEGIDNTMNKFNI